MRSSTPSSEPPRGVLGGQQLAQAPRRVAQRRGHRVPAIHDDGAVGRPAAGCRGGRVRSARAARLCWRVAPGLAPGEVAGGSGCAIAVALTDPAISGTASIDLTGVAAHKPRESRPAGAGRFSFAINMVRRLRGRVSRAAKGADCKSAGYAFVGSSPTSPTNLRASRRFGWQTGLDREGCPSKPAGRRRAKFLINSVAFRGCSSMVEQQPSKLMTTVRFRSPAPIFAAPQLRMASQPSRGEDCPPKL